MATPKTVNKPTTDSSRALPGHTTKYDYVLEWIRESIEARRAQNAYVERAVMAYQTKPSENRYKKTINQYIASVQQHDANAAAELRAACGDVPEKGSLVVQNAVETVISMTMGGVGQYQFGPYDPDMQGDDKTIDRLSAQAKFFYNNNKIDSIISQFICNAAVCGAAYMHIKQKNGKKISTLLESSQMITDPKRMKTNFERFIGFSQRESFRTVKDRVTKAKGGGYVLKTLNEANVYVNQIRQELNSVLQSKTSTPYPHDALRKDLDLFYQPIITQITASRQKDNPDEMYDGDEIEITYLYDLMNDLYFEVINRRYIIVAKKNPLSRDINCKYFDAAGREKTRTKTIKLDHPFIELPYNKRFWLTFPVSPLYYVLDDFDDLCAMESVSFHNLSIMAPITFVGQSSDAEKVSQISSVAGEVVEGLPQTFGVLNKTHDMTPIMTAIQRFEERIKRAMKAVDPFELQGMLGDRATAKEVVSASGQVSQGMNPFIANIETAMATLGDKFIKLELIMNDKELYSFTHNGKYYEVSRDAMASDFEVGAKLVSSIKLEQEANSRKALELIQYGSGYEEAIDKKEYLGTLIPIVLNGIVSREQARRMVKDSYRPMPDEVIAAIKKRVEEDARKDEADKLDLSQYTPEELDALAVQVGIPPAQLPATPTPVSGSQMPPAMPPEGQLPSAGANPPAPPVSPETAGVVANDQTGQGYGF